MKGFDAFQKPKETKIGKFIFNSKKPVKSKCIDDDDDEEKYKIGEKDTRDILRDGILDYSLKSSPDRCNYDENCNYDNCNYDNCNYVDNCNYTDAVINIKPRSRVLHSISEVPASDTEQDTMLSTSPGSPLEELTDDTNKENCPVPLYIVEGNELDMYLHLRCNHYMQQYNYAHLDPSMFLNRVEHMKESNTPLHRRRLGSTPAILQHSREYVDAKQKISRDHMRRHGDLGSLNDCDCGVGDNVKSTNQLNRSKSVDEVLFSHARNSSSYNKFKKSSPCGKFARYIKINGVEYKVPSNVPKHDPPDLTPPPALPPKGKCTTKATENITNTPNTECRLPNTNNDIEVKLTDECINEKEFSVYPEVFETVINDFPRRQQKVDDEQRRTDTLITYPTYVNDATYLDTIRHKRRQKSENQTLPRGRLDSCPEPVSSTYDNLLRGDVHDKLSRCITLPRMNRRYELPMVVPNSYSLKLNSPPDKEKRKTPITYDAVKFNATNNDSRIEENDIYTSPTNIDAASKTIPRCKKNDSPSPPQEVNSGGYVYAHPASRGLSDKMDYQYAYAHTQNLFHSPVKHTSVNRDKATSTIKKNPQPFYQRSRQTPRENTNPNLIQSDTVASYSNVKCFDSKVSNENLSPSDNNDYLSVKDNLFHVSPLDTDIKIDNKNNNGIPNHEYTYINTATTSLEEIKHPSKVNTVNKSINDDVTLSHARVGSSYNKFQNKLDYLIPSSKFAKYVNIEGSDCEYKVPSNVPKFDPPELVPPLGLFKENSHVQYEDAVELRFTNDNIDELISQGKGQISIIGKKVSN